MHLELISCADVGTVWEKKEWLGPGLLVGYDQIFPNETATNLKSSGWVAHSVHSVLLNCSGPFRRCLFERGFKRIAFPPVEYAEEDSVDELVKENTTYATYNRSDGNTVLLSDGVRLTSPPNSREHKF